MDSLYVEVLWDLYGYIMEKMGEEPWILGLFPPNSRTKPLLVGSYTIMLQSLKEGNSFLTCRRWTSRPNIWPLLKLEQTAGSWMLMVCDTLFSGSSQRFCASSTVGLVIFITLPCLASPLRVWGVIYMRRTLAALGKVVTGNFPVMVPGGAHNRG